MHAIWSLCFVYDGPFQELKDAVEQCIDNRYFRERKLGTATNRIILVVLRRS